ncbi:uncharacterized protein LOC131932821 [Physella acuta]|uniref:uncharacterized protein LOC131932821 n=1 Tax=Physella acuta TaxID=109671 RepID=UPI0027DE84B2|nr:uncharacterized protein LOC131932821 [Physella acuta]
MTQSVIVFWLLCLVGRTLVAVSVNVGRSDDSLRLVGFQQTREFEYSSNIIWGQYMRPNNSSFLPQCMRVYVDFCFLKDCGDSSLGWINICAMHTHPCLDIACPYNSSVVSIFTCTCDEKEHIFVDISRGPQEIVRNAAMRFRLASTSEPNSADVHVSRTFDIENELMDLVASSLTLEFLGFEQPCDDCYKDSVVYAAFREHQTVSGFNETFQLFVDVCITGNCKKSGSSWMAQRALMNRR